MLSLAVAVSARRLWPLYVRRYCQTAGLAAATAASRPADRVQRTMNWRSKTDVVNQFQAYMSRRQPESEAAAASPVLYSLVKACGSSMMVETPETKVELVQHMWKTLKESGLKWEVGLYNLLLQVYLLNDFRFSPSKIMEEMKACGVLPNQGTLAYLLQAYCQQGSLAGATQVLEYMKALNHPINEHIYAALITGHSRSGDMAGVQQVMVAMETKGLRPGAISFTALLCAHAERGDIEAIIKVTENMRLRRIFPNQPTYIKIMDSLSSHGHGHLIPQVLELVRNRQWMQSDLRDLASRCAVRGEFDSTMTILNSLDDPGHTLSSGPTVTEAVLRSQGKTMKEKLAMLERLAENGYEDNQHDAVMYHLLHEQKMEDAVAMVRDLHSKEVPIRMHYLYPVLAWFSLKKDLKGLLETTRLIEEVGLDVHDTRIASYCSRAVEGSGSDDLKLLDEAAKAGTLPHPLAEALVLKSKSLNMEQLHKLAPVASLSTLPKLLDDVSSVVRANTSANTLVKFYVTVNSRLKLKQEPSSKSLPPHTGQLGTADAPDSGPRLAESLEPSEADHGVGLPEPASDAPLGDQEVLESGLSDRLLGDLEAVETPQTGAPESAPSAQSWLSSLEIESPGTPPGDSQEMSETHMLILQLQSSVKSVVQRLCALDRKQTAKYLLQQLYRKGVAAGSEAYQELLQQNGGTKTRGDFFSVLEAIKSQGLTLRPKDNALILRMATDGRKRALAQAAFNELPDPRSYNYNDLLLATAHSGKPTQAWQIYAEMRGKDMTPDFLTYQHLMITLLSYRQWNRAHSVKEDFLAGKFSNKERAVCNAFVTGYVSNGRLPQARDEIAKLRELGIVPLDQTYLQLAEGCARHGSPGTILEVMKELEKGEDNSGFHRAMVSALVRAFLKCRQTEKALEVLDTFQTTPPYPTVLYQLAEELVEKGEMESVGKVLKVLAALEEKPLTTNDVVFGNHLKAGSIEEARQMLQSDFCPSENWYYFSQFGRSCADGKRPEGVKAVMDMLQEQNKLCDGIVIATLRGFVRLSGAPRSHDLPGLQAELKRTGRFLPEELNSLLQDSKKQPAPESLQEPSEAAAL